jgi:hypothetical protein
MKLKSVSASQRQRRHGVVGLREDSGKRVHKAGMCELETGGSEPGGIDPCPGEKRFVGHFTKCETEGEAGDGKKCRAVKVGGQSACELSIRDRIWCCEVDRSGNGGGFKEEEDGRQDVRHGDPTHELTAVAELGAESEAEKGEETGEGASRAGAEDNAEAEV